MLITKALEIQLIKKYEKLKINGKVTPINDNEIFMVYKNKYDEQLETNNKK